MNKSKSMHFLIIVLFLLSLLINNSASYAQSNSKEQLEKSGLEIINKFYNDYKYKYYYKSQVKNFIINIFSDETRSKLNLMDDKSRSAEVEIIFYNCIFKDLDNELKQMCADHTSKFEFIEKNELNFQSDSSLIKYGLGSAVTATTAAAAWGYFFATTIVTTSPWWSFGLITTTTTVVGGTAGVLAVLTGPAGIIVAGTALAAGATYAYYQNAKYKKELEKTKSELEIKLCNAIKTKETDINEAWVRSVNKIYEMEASK